MANKTGFPKAMIYVGAVLAAILVAEAAFLLIKGTDKQEAIVQKTTVSPLHIEQGQVCDASGQPVSFHGISYGWHNLWPRFYNAGSVTEFSKVWGVKMFRAAIGADDLHETGDNLGYISDPEGALQCLYNVVDAAIANNAYVIVDWHSHILHLEEATEFFKAVSKRYANCNNVIYEVFNEPVCHSFESEHSYEDLGNPEAMMEYWLRLKAYSEKIIQTITVYSNVHPLILVGNPSWDQRPDLCASAPVEDYDNVAYTVHFYAATHKQELRDRAEAAMAAGCPIFISECAACDASGNGDMDLESWQVWSDWADAHNISMLTWNVGDKNETSAMFTPEAASEGPWPDAVLKPWAQIVRNWVK